jgi:UDP-N-acetylmuramate-alanine ligase
MASFEKLVSLLPKDGVILADGDNANVRALIAKAPCKVVTFGLDSKVSLTADQVAFGEKTAFRALRDGVEIARFESPPPRPPQFEKPAGRPGRRAGAGIMVSDVQRALSSSKA